MLADLVRAGKLPALAERLPEEPLVVPPAKQVGKYGGTLRRLGVRPSDSLLRSRIGYESLVRWSRDGRHVEPGAAKSWEIENGARRYVLHLRRGMKWSDGMPFSSTDILFWFDDVASNKVLCPVFPSYFCPTGGRFRVLAPDPETVVFEFDKPNGIFLEFLCFRGGGMFYPAHYLKQFHQNYQTPEKLKELIEEAGLALWNQLFYQKANIEDNVDCPTIRAWKLSIGAPSTRLVVERNPYYWKVDPQGSQLPYIDAIATSLLQNKEILNLKALTGGVDMQARYIDSSKFTLFMKNRKKNGYRVQVNTTPGADVIYLNQCSKDPAMKSLLGDRRFRRALSVAVNRPELVELIYSGLAVPSNGVSSEADPHFLPEFGEKNLAYDPALANRLLDEMGMKRGINGLRRMPDGSRFQQILNFYPAETGTGAELWQLVADYWREVGLEFVVKSDARTLSVMQVRNGNSDFWAYSIAALHWVVSPGWYVPTNDRSYFAPLYGRYINRGGKSGVRPPPEFQRLADTYRELAGLADPGQRLALGRSILRQWAEECYIVGVIRRKDLVILSERMRNFPDSMLQDYRLMAPGYLCPEQFWLAESAK